MYERTCLQCPVKGSCTYAVPSAEYYTQGKLIARSPIAHSPQHRLFSDEEHASIVGPLRIPSYRVEPDQPEEVIDDAQMNLILQRRSK